MASKANGRSAAKSASRPKAAPVAATNGKKQERDTSPLPKQTDEQLRAIIKNWASLNRDVTRLSAKDLERAIQLEKNARARPNMLLRMLTRLGRVRASEEQKKFLTDFGRV